MAISRTLAWRVVGEITLYTALGLSALMLVLTSQNLVRRLDELTMVGFGASELLAVVVRLLPMLASYSIPVAFLLGILLTVQRMNDDGEVVAMRSCGMGRSTLVVPALTLALGVSALSAHLLIHVENRARNELLRTFRDVATRGGFVEPGEFRLLGRRMFYVEGRDREGGLSGVMIIDHTNLHRRLRIFAERGRIRYDLEARNLHFELESGDVQIRPPDEDPERHRMFAFDRLDYGFDVSELLGSAFSPERPRQMTMAELSDVIARAEAGASLDELDQRDPIEYALERERRLALPAAPMLFALVAVPLGLRGGRRGRAWGVVQCAAVVVGYYALITLGGEATREGWASPAMAFWLPNAIFATIGLLMLACADRVMD